MKRKNNGFTLVELMVVITIIALLSSLMLVAMFGAQESARAQKTRSIIAKLDAVILPAYEDYRARSVPIATSGLSGRAVAKARLDALRELQRLEMPDRWTDIGYINASGTPVLSAIRTSMTRPAIANSYFRRFAAAVAKAKTLDPTDYMDIVNRNEQAETLYLVVTMLGEDGLENFSNATIGDTDEDGAKEFLDGWNQPIRWLRWPAGFDSPINRVAGSAVTTTTSATVWSGDDNLSDQDDAYTGHVIRFTTGNLLGQMVRIVDYKGSTREFTVSGTSIAPAHASRFNIMGPDKFDSHKVYPPRPGDYWGNPANTAAYQPQYTFEIHPLVFSAGPDGEFGIVIDMTSPAPQLTYSTVNNNPYIIIDTTLGHRMGTPVADFVDNITNHDLGRR